MRVMEINPLCQVTHLLIACHFNHSLWLIQLFISLSTRPEIALVIHHQTVDWVSEDLDLIIIAGCFMLLSTVMHHPQNHVIWIL